jgi:uncharacterized damage-inducible protein DinB
MSDARRFGRKAFLFHVSIVAEILDYVKPASLKIKQEISHTAVAQNLPEPWLRGPIAGVAPAVMPVFFTFAQVREELANHTAGLTQDQVWTKPANVAAPLGFHLKHMAGSVDRLTTYLLGHQLSPAQLDSLRHESEPGSTLDELLRGIDNSLRASEEQLRQLNPNSLNEHRSVGRRELPTTVLGLIVHLSEHTQRHLGQAITTIKVIRHST